MMKHLNWKRINIRVVVSPVVVGPTVVVSSGVVVSTVVVSSGVVVSTVLVVSIVVVVSFCEKITEIKCFSLVKYAHWFRHLINDNLFVPCSLSLRKYLEPSQLI